MSIQIEQIFNGFIIHDFDFGEIGRKIAFENKNTSPCECTLEELANNKNLLYGIIELLGLRMATTDEKHSIILEIKNDQGDILPDV